MLWCCAAAPLGSCGLPEQGNLTLYCQQPEQAPPHLSFPLHDPTGFRRCRYLRRVARSWEAKPSVGPLSMGPVFDSLRRDRKKNREPRSTHTCSWQQGRVGSQLSTPAWPTLSFPSHSPAHSFKAPPEHQQPYIPANMECWAL